MNRLYTKDATGIAPNGRWFAGDINALQDAVAAQTDFTQTISLGTLAIGDSTIQLVKYGAKETRISAALRTDGVIRGLGGLFAGTFTTTARDAIPSGATPQQKPYGIIILNTTTNQFEWNAGTDAAPSWQPVGQSGVPTGAILDHGGATAPTGFLLCDGTAVSRTTYAALYAALGGAASPWGQGNGTTTFNVPDMRGRVTVGKAGAGTFFNLAAVGGEETHTLIIGEMPSHDHGSSTSSVSAGTPAGTVSVAASGILTTGSDNADHHHAGSTDVGGPSGATILSFTTAEAVSGGTLPVVTGITEGGTSHSHTYTTGGRSSNHQHDLASHAHTATFTGSALAAHAHAVSAQGGGGAHNNVQPFAVTNKIIKT